MTFIEGNVEKIIMVVVGLVCLWLLATRVVMSPNAVPFENRKFSPGSIDPYLYRQAEDLQMKLRQSPSKLPPYKPVVDEYLARMQTSVQGVEMNLWPALPYAVVGTEGDREYSLPQIGEIQDVAVEHIRAVAYIPTEPVTLEKQYENTSNEANDIDLVTVEGRFDIAGLHERFNESYMGDDVPREWRDPCLAKPVFASVQLQRQELDEDGVWSEWESVPRSRIDHFGTMLESITEADELPLGGVKVRLLQFDRPDVQSELLQPKAYQIASANEEWFPPALHRKYLTLRADEERQEKRDALEEKAKQRSDQSDSLRPRRSNPRTRSSSTSGGAAYEAMGILGGAYEGRDSRSRSRSTRYDRGTDGRFGQESGRRTRTRGRDDGNLESDLLQRAKELAKKRSSDDVYGEFYEIMIDPMTDLSKMRELLAIWAHDDTVEPGKTYRYRMRLGVFNPTGGTSGSAQAAASRKNNAVLWSEYSDVTEAVDIPRMIYFFAKSVQEAAKTVDVQVSKYVLGHWYSKDFPAVGRGEVIGGVVENEVEKKKPLLSFGGRPVSTAQKTNEATEPDVIDYRTGAILVDAVLVNEWAGGNKNYYDMLYSYDGDTIEHMPAKSTYWDPGLRNAFFLINRLQREPKEPFRAWNSSPRGSFRRGLEYMDGGYDDLMEREMMMMEQQRRGR